MKRFLLTLSLLILMAVSLFPIACSYPPSYPPNYGGTATSTPTPTATIPPVVLSHNSSVRYSTGGTGGASLSAPITISVGQGVAWDASNSPNGLYIGNNASTCNLSDNTSYPVTYVFTIAGDYLAHSDVYGNCSGGDSTCLTSGCTGEAATIHVQ